MWDRRSLHPAALLHITASDPIAGAQIVPQAWQQMGYASVPPPLGTCTFVLFDDAKGGGVSLGTVAVWPPTQQAQLQQQASLCMLQLGHQIPPGSYSVRPRDPLQ